MTTIPRIPFLGFLVSMGHRDACGRYGGVGGQAKPQAFGSTNMSSVIWFTQVSWGSELGCSHSPSPNPPSAFPTPGPGLCVYSHEEWPWLLKDTHPNRVEVTRTYISVVLLGMGSSVALLSPC